MTELAFRGLDEMQRALADAHAACARAEAQCEELRAQLAQSQKLETLGLLAGGLAHDMNNVLACIVGLAGPLRDDLPPETTQWHDADVIHEQAMHATGLTRKLLAFVRKASSIAEPLDVARLVDDVTQLLAHTLPRRIVLVATLDHGEVRVLGDPSQVRHALVNLCINAADAMTEGGTITLTSRVRSGTLLELLVADQGCGMDPETLARATEPFFTTKAAGKGTGLGLAIVARTMQGHGGTLELESEPGRGTRARLLLPLCN